MALFARTANAAARGLKLTACLAGTLSLSVGLTVGGALAQDTTATESPITWFKICNEDPRVKKNVCVVKQDLLSESGQFLASMQMHVAEGEARKRLIAAVPPGMLIQPGLHLKIDDKDVLYMKYGICLEDVCIAELAVNDDFVTVLKQGSEMNLTAFNQQGKERPYSFTLAGFVEAFDGPGLDEQQAAKLQEDLRKQIETRTDGLRQKLIDAQRKATGN